MSRTMWWVSGALAALLIAVIIVVSVLLVTVQKEAAQDAWEDCLARHGVASDEAPPAGTDPNEYLAGAVAAAKECDAALNG